LRRGICICVQANKHPVAHRGSTVIRTLLCSAPNDDQHCYHHDGSGGMRESRHDVDDAGDASNTEIGHVAYLPSRTSIAITPCVRSCQIGLSRAKRESGEGTLAGSQTDPRLEQCRCNAKPDLRYRARAATIAFCQPAAGIATNESDLAHGKRRSGILCQALFRVDLQVVEHSTRNANTFHRENMFHRDGLAATIASKTNASRRLESRDARRTASRRGGVCWHPAWLGPIFQNCIKVTSH
jgi:hypothetical protein